MDHDASFPTPWPSPAEEEEPHAWVNLYGTWDRKTFPVMLNTDSSFHWAARVVLRMELETVGFIVTEQLERHRKVFLRGAFRWTYVGERWIVTRSPLADRTSVFIVTAISTEADPLEQLAQVKDVL